MPWCCWESLPSGRRWWSAPRSFWRCCWTGCARACTGPSENGIFLRDPWGPVHPKTERGGSKVLEGFRRGLVSALWVLAVALLASATAWAQTFAVVPKSVDNPFFIDVENGARAAAEELGVRMEFVGPQTTDIAQQISVLEDLIVRGVDGIALSPVDAQSVLPVLERARKAGIPVVTFDSDTAGGAGRVAFIGTDNYAAGVSAGEAFVRALPSGTYAILTGGLGA